MEGFRKAETLSRKPPPPGPSRGPAWGQNQALYLAALRGRQVAVVFGDGKALVGELTGVDTYNLFIRQASGLEVMINKGAIKYLHPSG
jgi:small nuclear ribonucleoprotein (snRNP)-like protein